MRKADRLYNLLDGLVCVFKPPKLTQKALSARIATSLAEDHVNKSKLERALTIMRSKFAISRMLQCGLRNNTQKAYLALSNCWKLSEKGPTTTRMEIKPRVGSQFFDENDSLLSKWELRPELGQVEFTSETRKMEDHMEAAQEMHNRRLLSSYVHRIECVDFDPPFFTLEIEIIHETTDSIIEIVTNLAPHLKCVTVCTKIRRTSYGKLNLEDSLLLKHIRFPINVKNSDESSGMLPNPTSPDVYEPNVLTNIHTCASKYPYPFHVYFDEQIKSLKD
ncbi:TruB pseudouridine (psi) synthase 2 [Cichlidogyrus casuarinus]|uniref:TruB pseudouridine (Psi) synthase 2 n=1 Tax=Cichlidogyrus casuarinus TaxID=1844966 RepID=A0ABD2Q1T2_9PLAT